MLSLRPFQIALLVGFLFLAFASLILLQNFSPVSGTENNIYGNRVVVWGPFPYNEVAAVISNIADQDEQFEVVDYVSIPPEQFAGRFVNAIAEGNSPDLVMLPHTELVSQRSKLQPIPYDTDGFSLRDIRDTYIDGTELFALQDGMYGVPYLVDPLLMYWNRDLFAGAGFTGAPTTWEQVVGEVTTSLTIRDNSRNLMQSAVAFGEVRNVRNAVPVLSLLAMQSGSQLVNETSRGYEVALNETAGSGRPPLDSALQFYTDFANASNPLYSWNRARPEDRLAFIGAQLAIYFGFASEANMIQERNPNLNFDASLPPQGANATVRRTYGTFYSLAIPRASQNQQGAFNAARVLANPQNSLDMAVAVNHVPTNRSALRADITDPYTEVAYQAALFARGWLSPSPTATAAAFEAMVEDVNSSRSRVNSAVADALNRLIMAY